MPEKVKKEGGAAPVHVMINAPGEARRSLLSLAIDLVRLQKKHRDFLNRKKEKEEFMRKLRRNVAEIKELMKILDSYELPVSLEQIENLPQFRKHREAIRRMEEVRQRAESKIMESEEEFESIAHEKPRPVPKKARELERKNEPPKAPKAASQRIEKKPEDKLESDLEELQRKLDSI